MEKVIEVQYKVGQSGREHLTAGEARMLSSSYASYTEYFMLFLLLFLFIQNMYKRNVLFHVRKTLVKW